MGRENLRVRRDNSHETKSVKYFTLHLRFVCFVGKPSVKIVFHIF